MKKSTTVMALALIFNTGAAQAAPGDMSVATFLSKADALAAKGFMALLSPDYKLLKSEATAGGLAYRARLQGERAAGHPSSCPPHPAPINSATLISHLKSYPETARMRTSMKAAMADLFVKTWPCSRG